MRFLVMSATLRYLLLLKLLQIHCIPSRPLQALPQQMSAADHTILSHDGACHQVYHRAMRSQSCSSPHQQSLKRPAVINQRRKVHPAQMPRSSGS